MPKTNKLKVFQSMQEASTFLKAGAAVAIGNYDGFHYGHQVIINNLNKKAKSLKLKSVLLTFEPHPVKILAPDVAPRQICTTDQKIELLTQSGLDVLIIQKFDKAFAKTQPENFIKKHLVKELHTKYLTIGYDFTFGSQRSGTIETLERFSADQNITIAIIEAQMQNNVLVSSSIIRKMILEGNLPLANKLLTRDYFIDGCIIKGHNRGTALGIHTANLKTTNELLPSDGVYATFFRLGTKTYKSVTNIGFNPTFDNQERSIETHIFNFEGDIYNKNVRLYFVKKLRVEIKFATPTALVKQIGKDIQTAKDILKGHKLK